MNKLNKDIKKIVVKALCAAKLALVLSACGSNNIINTEKDKRLTQYIEQFESITGRDTSHIVSWRIEKIKGKYVAVARKIGFDDGTVVYEIVYDPGYFSSDSPITREATMMHEIVHTFDIGHTDSGLMHEYNQVTVHTVRTQGVNKAVLDALMQHSH